MKFAKPAFVSLASSVNSFSSTVLKLKHDLPCIRFFNSGDTVRYATTMTGLVDLKSRPDWGLWLSMNEAVNESGLTVMTFTGQVLAERRTPFAPSSAHEK